MENIVKKIAIFSMIGMMQIGLCTSVLEASPRYNAMSSGQRQDDRRDKEGNGHEPQRDERERVEKERHEREMKRRDHESERAWHERQQREQERHEENMRRIAHDILELVLDR